MKKFLRNLGVAPFDENVFTVKKLKWVAKNLYQIATRGFSDVEIIDLRSSLTDYILPRLKAFQTYKDRFGAPSGLTEAEWCEILEAMTRAFSLLRLDDDGVCLTKNQNRDIKKGLSLFSEWYVHLWD